MRLVTRSDFDGLACAVLLVEAGVVDSFKFVHPKDVQDGLVEVTKDDVLANVPYARGCGLWFDHHSSEDERLLLEEDFTLRGASLPAPSCARVVYDYYNGSEKFEKLDRNGLMAAVDKTDSGDLTLDEIKNPRGWVLLSFMMDPRTGLGHHKGYRISNYQLMEDMIKYCRTMGPEEILKVPDVQERVRRYEEQQRAFEDMLRSNTTVDGNVIVTDLRNVGEIASGNRFTIYALYPEQNVSVQIMSGKEKKNVVFSVGHSIVNRTAESNVGSLMLKFGGGGHEKVGTCQVPPEDAERVRGEIIKRLKAGR
ncbi:MAG: exopolyphosphatase [Deltaproteobacteria bacterium]|nr:exopolyphosphatase [Deltaproteobacteria bacterium]